MTKDEALRLALKALETLHDENMNYLTRNKLGGENNQCMVFAREAITAIKAALEAKDEPYGYVWFTKQMEHRFTRIEPHLQIDAMNVKPVYATPPQRKPLTDEEIQDLLMPVRISGDGYYLRIARAIKAAIEVKNEPDYKELWQQMCERCDSLDKKLAQRTWVEIDDEDFSKALELCDFDKVAAFEFFEDKLRSKNNG